MQFEDIALKKGTEISDKNSEANLAVKTEFKI